MSKYERITQFIAEELNDCTGSWEASWRLIGEALAVRPINVSTSKSYNGGNVFTLGLVALNRYERDARFVAYKQCINMGGQVKEGAKGYPVLSAGSTEKEDDKGEKTVRIFTKWSTVFHVSQTNLIELEKVPEYVPSTKSLIPPADICPRASQFLVNTGAKIEHNFQESAYYNRVTDTIALPKLEQFESDKDYFSVALHELTHWTGAKSRLAREKGTRFGDTKYAFEELIAELGSAYICADLGLEYETRVDHIQYIKNWLNHFKQDVEILFKASSSAIKAVNYLHSLQVDKPLFAGMEDKSLQLSLIA